MKKIFLAATYFTLILGVEGKAQCNPKTGCNCCRTDCFVYCPAGYNCCYPGGELMCCPNETGKGQPIPPITTIAKEKSEK